jgi:hypothetical protein
MMAVAVIATASAADAPHEGWYSVQAPLDPICLGNGLPVQVAAGLINRLEGRPAAMYSGTTWNGAGARAWLEQVQKFDAIAANTEYRNVTCLELLETAVQIKAATGAVLFNLSEQHSISTVVTLCGVHRALPLTGPAAAARLNLPVVFDTRQQWKNSMEATEYAVTNLLNSTSRKAMVLQKPAHLDGGYLADLAVAGWPGDDEDKPLLAIWPESPYTNPDLPLLCNPTAPEHKLFADLTEGATGQAHGWEGPGEVGRKMPTVIGYHDKGPGAWAECINLCTPNHRTISLVANVASNLAFFSRAAPVDSLPAPHPVLDAGPFNSSKTYVAIVNSDGDNLAFDEVRGPLPPGGTSAGTTIAERAKICSEPGAVCPPVSHTMSNRLVNLAPSILQWW